MADLTTKTIGTLLCETARRDAVHIALAPVVAAERLNPGDHVGIVGERAAPCDNPIGIVDPFLRHPVYKGERFWLFLYPLTITSLRHEWTHPAFPAKGAAPAPEQVAEAEAWLREYAHRVSPYYAPGEAFDNLMEGLRNDEVYYYGSDLHGFGELEDADDLRRYAEIYLGIPIIWANFTFSCGC